MMWIVFILLFPTLLFAQETKEPVLDKKEHDPGVYLSTTKAKGAEEIVGVSIDRTDWTDPATTAIATVEVSDDGKTFKPQCAIGAQGTPTPMAKNKSEVRCSIGNATHYQTKIEIAGGKLNASVDLVTK